MIFKKPNTVRKRAKKVARNREPTIAEYNPYSPKLPTNKALVELGKVYQERAPAVLGPRIDEARDFLINVIAPRILALENGLQDGVEVLRLAMNEEPQASKYFIALHSMLEQALSVKMATFISKQCSLTPRENELFLSMALGKKGSEASKISELIKELGGDEPKGPLGNTAINDTERPGPNPRQLKRQHMAILNREQELLKGKKNAGVG